MKAEVDASGSTTGGDGSASFDVEAGGESSGGDFDGGDFGEAEDSDLSFNV